MMGDADMRLVRSGVIALVVTVAAFVATAPATVAGAQSSSTTTTTSAGASSKTTSPTAWANGVCSSVQTWLDSVNSTVKGLKGAGSLDAATTQATTGVKTATDTLTSSVDALGTPSTGDGPKAKTAVNNLVDAAPEPLEQHPADTGEPGLDARSRLPARLLRWAAISAKPPTK